EDNGVPFLALQFLHGETLQDRLNREHRLPAAEVVRIGREMAAALGAAHAIDLVHRDIKPANVWLEAGSGRVKVLDLGLARLADDATNLTRTGVVVGTPAFMAPEQARGQAVDGRADLFSLGVVLYVAATGVRPFNGPDTMAILTSLALDHPPSPHELQPDIPVELSDLIMRLLAKDPDQRLASAAELAQALAAVKTSAGVSNLWSEQDVVVRAPSPSRTGPSWRTIAIAAGLLVALVGGVILLAIILMQTDKGTLIVEVDGDADVRFKNGELHIYDEKG